MSQPFPRASPIKDVFQGFFYFYQDLYVLSSLHSVFRPVHQKEGARHWFIYHKCEKKGGSNTIRQKKGLWDKDMSLCP
jgi:hypothetical protein